MTFRIPDATMLQSWLSGLGGGGGAAIAAANAEANSVVSAGDVRPGLDDMYPPHISQSRQGARQKKRDRAAPTGGGVSRKRFTVVAEEERDTDNGARQRAMRAVLDNMDESDREAHEKDEEDAWEPQVADWVKDLYAQFGRPGPRSQCWGCSRLFKGRIASEAYEEMHANFVNTYLNQHALRPTAYTTHQLFRKMVETQDHDECNHVAHGSKMREIVEWPEIDIIFHFLTHDPSYDCKRILYMIIDSSIDEYYLTEGIFEYNTLTSRSRVNSRNLADYHKHADASRRNYNKPTDKDYCINRDGAKMSSIPRPPNSHTVPRHEIAGTVL